VNDPYVGTDLDRIDGAKGVTSMPQCNFKYASVNAFESFRLVGLAALGCDGQRAENFKLGFCGEVLEISQGSLQL
jgi:hypothetical protein